MTYLRKYAAASLWLAKGFPFARMASPTTVWLFPLAVEGFKFPFQIPRGKMMPPSRDKKPAATNDDQARLADDAAEDLAEEVEREEIALTPSESADPQSLVEAKIPADIRNRYEVYSYRNAAVILSESHQAEFNQILDALRAFSITSTMIRIHYRTLFSPLI